MVRDAADRRVSAVTPALSTPLTANQIVYHRLFQAPRPDAEFLLACRLLVVYKRWMLMVLFAELIISLLYAVIKPPFPKKVSNKKRILSIFVYSKLFIKRPKMVPDPSS